MLFARKTFCIALTLTCMLASVSADGAPPEASIYPVQIGNKWTYQAGVVELVEEVMAYEMVGDERCVRIDTSLNGKVVANEHLAIRPDGIYRVAIAGQTVTPPLCFLKHPAPTGTEWAVQSSVKGQPIAGKFKLGVETIEVPAGTFEAVSVKGKDFESDGKPLDFTYYFVPGIGKAKQVVKIDGRGIELTLKKFEPARQ